MWLPLDGDYLFCKNLQNTLKTLPKYVTNAAYKLKTISLTGTPHNHKFFRKLLECVGDIVFLLIKNKANLFNKENCFVAIRAGYIVFTPNFILFF